MSWVRVWIHFVFSTKHRHPYLSDSAVREQFFDHIRKNALSKEIWIDRINGYIDHCHCLVSLSATQSVSKIAQQIKGESSLWISRNVLVEGFAWQNDYFAVSVSESQVDAVRRYIDNQEEHHKRQTFAEEQQTLMLKYNFTKNYR